MSAQELRDAAKVLRARVKAVHDGAAEPDMWFGVDELELALRHGDQAEMGDPIADATYIATMHPGVGLALADLLDTLADDREVNGEIDGRTWDHNLVPLARLILGRA